MPRWNDQRISNQDLDAAYREMRQATRAAGKDGEMATGVEYVPCFVSRQMENGKYRYQPFQLPLPPSVSEQYKDAPRRHFKVEGRSPDGSVSFVATCRLPDALIAEGYWARGIAEALGLPDSTVQSMANAVMTARAQAGSAGKRATGDYEMEEVVVTAERTRYLDLPTLQVYLSGGVRQPSGEECMAGQGGEGCVGGPGGGGTGGYDDPCSTCVPAPPRTPVNCNDVAGVISANRSRLQALAQQSIAAKKEMAMLLSPTIDPNVWQSWQPSNYLFQSGCRSVFQFPSNLPPGTIMIHTHPYYTGQNIYIYSNWDPDCRDRGDYNIGYIHGDQKYISRITNTRPNVSNIGIVVDGQGVIAYNHDDAKYCTTW